MSLNCKLCGKEKHIYGEGKNIETTELCRRCDDLSTIIGNHLELSKKIINNLNEKKIKEQKLTFKYSEYTQTIRQMPQNHMVAQRTNFGQHDCWEVETGGGLNKQMVLKVCSALMEYTLKYGSGENLAKYLNGEKGFMTVKDSTIHDTCVKILLDSGWEIFSHCPDKVILWKDK